MCRSPFFIGIVTVVAPPFPTSILKTREGNKNTEKLHRNISQWMSSGGGTGTVQHKHPRGCFRSVMRSHVAAAIPPGGRSNRPAPFSGSNRNRNGTSQQHTSHQRRRHSLIENGFTVQFLPDDLAFPPWTTATMSLAESCCCSKIMQFMTDGCSGDMLL